MCSQTSPIAHPEFLPSPPSLCEDVAQFSALHIWALMAAPRWGWRGKRTCFAFICVNQILIRTNDHNISRSWQMACLCVHPRFMVSESEKERKSLKVRGWLLFFGVFCVADDRQTDTHELKVSGPSKLSFWREKWQNLTLAHIRSAWRILKIIAAIHTVRAIKVWKRACCIASRAFLITWTSTAQAVRITG